MFEKYMNMSEPTRSAAAAWRASTHPTIPPDSECLQDRVSVGSVLRRRRGVARLVVDEGSQQFQDFYAESQLFFLFGKLSSLFAELFS
jgi:hypothetical protein